MDEVIEKLKPFASTDCTRPKLMKVSVRRRKAYATDGRILAVHDIDSDADDSASGFPFDNADKIISDAGEPISPVVIEEESYREAEKEFLSRLEYERKKASGERAERYVDVVCPHCGEEMYFDSEANELVEQIPPEAEVDPKDVQLPVLVEMAHGDKAPLSFALLRTAVMSLGTGIVIWRPNGDHTIAIASSDGKARAAIMPLSLRSGFTPSHIIKTRPAHLLESRDG